MPAGMDPGHPNGVLGGVGAAVGEEHLVVALGREVADCLRGPAAHQRGMLRRESRLHGRLSLDGGHNLGCWCPMLVLTSWLEKSSIRLPSKSQTWLPWPEAKTRGVRAPCALQEWKTWARSSA